MGTGSLVSSGVASIEQRGAAWRVVWRHAGAKRYTTWHVYENAVQAKQIVEAHRGAITPERVEAAVFQDDTLIDGNRNVITVRQLADDYLALRPKGRVAPDTKARYRRQLDTVILPAIGDLPADRVTGRDIVNIVNDLHGRVAPTTVDRYYSLIFGMFQWAKKDGIIPSNPAERSDHIRGMIAHDDTTDEGDDHVYLEPWEFDLIAANTAPHARPLVEFLAATGARWSEATAVVKKAIHRRPPGVRIHQAWKRDEKNRPYRGSTKGRQRRLVTLSAADLDALPDLTGVEPDGLIFRTPTGAAWNHSNFVNRVWGPAIVAASRCPIHPPPSAGRQLRPGEQVGARCGDNGGVRSNGKPCGLDVVPGWDRCYLPAHRQPPPGTVSTCTCEGVLRRRPTPHDLRHSHAAWQIFAGVQLLAISRRLGHRSTDTTEQIYAGLLPKQQQEAGETFRKLLGR